ncbi:MAG: endonuclease domain-containing protein [Thiolinea sp.]
MLDYNKNLRQPARKLRKQQTEAECLLWRHLRKKQLRGLQFYRQRPLGHFIVDFYCPAAKKLDA